MKILIPTCLRHEDLIPMVEQLHATIGDDDQLIVSCQPGSAAINRNWCLDHANLKYGEIAIMLDDDIEGFYPGWTADLTYSLRKDESVVAASARLLNPDGTVGQTCSRCYECEPEEIEVKSNGKCIIPTAAIAFQYRGIRFDESYRGSGWEDSDWAMQYLMHDLNSRFIQSNRCKLVHRNEQKCQGGSNWEFNRDYFYRKWLGGQIHV